MGDRAQVFMKKEKVYLYTHWGSYELLKTVQNAMMRGKERWDDPEYLARIIFCEMLGDDTKGLTGLGIGGDKHNDINRLITVDTENEEVSHKGDGDDFKCSFQEFVDKKMK